MRVLLEIVEKVTDSIRLVMGLIMLTTMVLGLILSGSASYLIPKAADSVAERGERFGEKAIKAHERRLIAEDMAKDGWGYDAATASVGSAAGQGQSPTAGNDGWAD